MIYFVRTIYNAPDLPIDNRFNLESNCTTVGGPATNYPCIFPFEYQGSIRNNCIWDTSDESYWCSTLVDKSGQHVSGNWGNCDANCPIVGRYPNCLKKYISPKMIDLRS